MATVKPIEANLRTVQKWTGPQTTANISSSPCNASTNVLPIQSAAVLPHEDGDAFERLIAGWIRDLAPNSEAERTLVRQLAIICWKLDRAERHETAVLSNRVIEAVGTCDCDEDSLATFGQAAAIASFDSSSEGERLRKYQFALMRELRQMIDAVAKLRKQVIATNEAKSPETYDVPENVGSVSSETDCDDEADPYGRHRETDPAASHDQSSSKPDTALTPPNHRVFEDHGRDVQTAAEPPATNEAIAKVANQPQAGRKRDRWPLKTLKKQQRHAQRLRKSTVAELPTNTTLERKTRTADLSNLEFKRVRREFGRRQG